MQKYGVSHTDMFNPRLLLAGVAFSLFAQQTDVTVIRETVNMVTDSVIVTDDEGSYVNGLKPSDFRLYDNGKPQDITVDVTSTPISLAVAVQANSETDMVLPKIKKVASLLQALVAGEQGEVAILSFDHRIQVLQDFTSDPDLIAKGMEKLKSGSQSHRMIDAAMQGIHMLSTRPTDRRRVLMLISETIDGSSENKTREVLTSAQFANIIIYPVIINRMISTLTAKAPVARPDPYPAGARPLPAGVPPTPEATRSTVSGASNSISFIPVFIEIFKQVKGIFIPNPMEVFSKFTGGREYPFITQKDLESAIQKVGQELRCQYTLSYKPDNKMEAGWHDITVEVMDRTGHVRRDVKILSKPGYWLAAVPD
jgi:VWFA-related protein